MASPEQICRLCLDEIPETYETLDNGKKEMLENISLNLDLSLTNYPLVCLKCRDALQQSYDFKMTCLANCKVKLETEEVVQSDTVETFVNHESICRVCLRHLGNDYFVKFTMNDDLFFGNMLRKCLPEIELNVTDQPSMCFDCMGHCQNMFTFVTNCLNNDGKLNKYVQTNGTTSNGHINLSEAIKCIRETNSLNCAQQETLRENFDAASWDSIIKKEFQLLQEDEIDIKSEEEISLEVPIVHQSSSTQENTSVYKCTECGYKSKYKHRLKAHSLIHKNNSTVHKCTECSYQARNQDCLQTHMSFHRNNTAPVQKSYASGFTSWLQEDQKKSLIPKDVPKVVTHKCTKCDYVASQKIHLQKHMLIHVDVADLSDLTTVYKCTDCSYWSKDKYVVERHMLKHNSKVTLYKSAEHNFESGYKSWLQNLDNPEGPI